MKRRTREYRYICFTVALSAGLLAFSGTALAMEPPAIPSLSQDQVEALNGGEVVIDVIEGRVPEGDAMGVINAPPEAVMRVVEDFDSYTEYMDDMELSEVVSQEGDVYILHGITDTPWPMENREWQIRAEGGPTQVDGVDVILSTWSYVEDSGNVVDTNGYWLAIPWGDDGQQTLLRYHIQVDLGTWLPDFLLEWSTENFLPERINAIRDRTMELQAAATE